MMEMMEVKNINLYVYTLQCMHAISSISMYYVVNISIMVCSISYPSSYALYGVQGGHQGWIPGITGSEGSPRTSPSRRWQEMGCFRTCRITVFTVFCMIATSNIMMYIACI
jgi:hypothetical protein